MNKLVQNPVISDTDGVTISKTFISVLPEMPVNILNHKDLAIRMAENESSEKNDVDKAKARFEMSRRHTELCRVDMNNGWLDFGAPTTGLNMTVLSNERGIQITMKNHREEVVKCNLVQLKREDNKHLAEYIQTALDIADRTNQIVKFHTSSFGQWSSTEWFNGAYVTLTPRK